MRGDGFKQPDASMRCPTVWLIGPSAYNTLSAMTRAFERLGWEATGIPYELVRSRIRRWLWKLAPKLRRHTSLGWRPWFEARWYNQFFRSQILPPLQRQPPDLLVFIRPYRLAPDLQTALQKVGRPILTWATDSLDRYGRYAGVWDIAARNYVFDGADACEPARRWLPLGFDDELYRPADRREWDVLFVGRIFFRLYDQRLNMLQRLAASRLPAAFRVAWAGSVVRQHKALARRFQEQGGVHLGDLSSEALAQAVARAWVAVTVHQDDGSQPVNPMFFAIPGCRTCLVTDQRDYLARWLEPGREFVPVTPDNFVSKLSALLDQEPDREKLAEAGYRAALRHTWVERIRAVLQDLQLAQSTP